MTEKLIDGDYKKEDGRLVTCELCEELLQNAFVLLKTKRKKFYPNKDFGSFLYKVDENTPAELISAYARQALYNLDGVFVKKSEIINSQIVISLIINDSEGEVKIPLENNV